MDIHILLGGQILLVDGISCIHDPLPIQIKRLSQAGNRSRNTLRSRPAIMPIDRLGIRHLSHRQEVDQLRHNSNRLSHNARRVVQNHRVTGRDDSGIRRRQGDGRLAVVSEKRLGHSFKPRSRCGRSGPN